MNDYPQSYISMINVNLGLCNLFTLHVNLENQEIYKDESNFTNKIISKSIFSLNYNRASQILYKMLFN